MNLMETKRYKRDGLLSGQFQRRYNRTKLFGFVVNLADGNKVIDGIVENISIGGFESANFPKTFTAEKHTYTVVLTDHDKHYKMLAKPCWKKKNGENNIAIGFKILSAPWKWAEFAMNRIPESRVN